MGRPSSESKRNPMGFAALRCRNRFGPPTDLMIPQGGRKASRTLCRKVVGYPSRPFLCARLLFFLHFFGDERPHCRGSDTLREGGSWRPGKRPEWPWPKKTQAESCLVVLLVPLARRLRNVRRV